MAPPCDCPPPSYRLYVKRQGAGGNYCVTVRDGKLFLTLPNNCDPYQLWHKNESSKCGFMLINKAADKPVKYCGNGDQLQLVNKQSCPDKSILWAESEDKGFGYRYFRTQSNLGMVMDAWTGNIFDGTKISIHPENKNINGPPEKNADNQLWKLVPCCKFQLCYPILLPQLIFVPSCTFSTY